MFTLEGINNVEFEVLPIPAYEEQYIYSVLSYIDVNNPASFIRQEVLKPLDDYLKYVYAVQNEARKPITPQLCKELGLKGKHLIDIKAKIIESIVEAQKNV